MASALSTSFGESPVLQLPENVSSPTEEILSIFPQSSCIETEVVAEELERADMENIEDRLRKASMTSSIHELQDDSAAAVGSSSGLEPPILDAPEAEDVREDEEEEIFEDAHEELQESPADPSPTRSCQEQATSGYNASWRSQPKHFFILSEAGKPIYSRHGDEDELSSLMAVMQAHVEFVHDLGDTIRAIHCADTTIAFLNKRPLILVAVSKGTDSITQLIVQMTYLYHQLLSVITLTQLTRIFDQKKGYDLRKMIAGSERLLDSLSSAMDSDPSFMLSSARVLPMPQASREIISNAISQHCGKVKNVVFAILIAGSRLITLVRMKKYFIHPADLHLIFNLVNSSESFKHSESWTPICLPKFDSSGFMHAHVSYLSDDCPACLFMLTVERDAFFELSEAKKKIVASLEKSNMLAAINESLKTCEYSTSSIGVPEIRHFLYKSKTAAQFTSSKHSPPYVDAASKARLHKIYLFLQSKLHSTSRPLKLVYYSGHKENVIAWASQMFEVYAAFDPLSSKSRAMNGVNKLLKWCKKEENALFILSAPTF